MKNHASPDLDPTMSRSKGFDWGLSRGGLPIMFSGPKSIPNMEHMGMGHIIYVYLCSVGSNMIFFGMRWFHEVI